MKLGITSKGIEVRISSSAPNRHISIFGISGAGKTVRVSEIERDAVAQGKTIISFSLENSSKPVHTKDLNYIEANTEGLNLPLLDTELVKQGRESHTNFVAYITELLAGTQNFGCRQTGVLREAVEYAIEHFDEYDSEMDAIAEALARQESSTAIGVYNRLWALLHSDIFKKNGKQLQPGCRNVIALGGLASNIQKAVVEMTLGILWRTARLKGTGLDELIIVIDEFQRLNLKKDSVLMEMLREARQYKISLVLITQSSGIFSKEVMGAIDQTATAMFFMPTAKEIKKIADTIDPQQSEHYVLLLKKLKKGESIVTGKIAVNGNETDKPMVIRSEYGFHESGKTNLPVLFRRR